MLTNLTTGFWSNEVCKVPPASISNLYIIAGSSECILTEGNIKSDKERRQTQSDGQRSCLCAQVCLSLQPERCMVEERPSRYKTVCQSFNAQKIINIDKSTCTSVIPPICDRPVFAIQIDLVKSHIRRDPTVLTKWYHRKLPMPAIAHQDIPALGLNVEILPRIDTSIITLKSQLPFDILAAREKENVDANYMGIRHVFVIDVFRRRELIRPFANV